MGCAMVTPFDDEGRLDIDGARRLARWLCDHGNDFLVLAGTTGESPTLSDKEKIELWREVAASVRVPVIAGAGTADTAHSTELTQAAKQAGAAGIWPSPPTTTDPLRPASRPTSELWPRPPAACRSSSTTSRSGPDARWPRT